MIGRLLGSDRGERSDGDGEGRGDGGSQRALVFALLALPVLVATYILLLVLSVPRTGGDELRLDQFYAMLDQGRIRTATMLAADSRVTGRYDRGRYWTAYVPSETQLGQVTTSIQQAEVPLEVDQQAAKQLLQPLTLLLPALILVDGFVIIIIIFRGGREVFNFGKSGARRFSGGSRITFDDVAGLDEAIEELQEIRDYLADPERFMVMGAAVPKGILLTGPPGCGKTLLARAVAGESDVPFFNISGSDFVEMFVGVGAARIRDLFRLAKEEAPAIVFIDELDAVGRGRRANAVGGQDEREATLNQLLVELDGFESGSGVVVLAATNRVDVLDQALLRPGRFDRRIPIDRPDIRGREGILRIHARGKPLADDVDLAHLARRTPGFSGADLANVVNEGALLAARRGETEIGMAHLLEAIERVIAGPERKSRIMSDENRRRLGVHEAGHAVVSAALPSARAVEKVSIVSRGHAGGFTWYLPDEDQQMVTRAQLQDRMTSLLAGRAAEELLTGDLSSGAQRDLSQATRVAREMVGRLGMSDRLGPLSVEQTVDAELNGHLTRYSEELLSTIDEAVVEALDEAEERSRRLLEANVDLLEELADTLIAEESLEGEALQAILSRVVSEPRLDGHGDRQAAESTRPG